MSPDRRQRLGAAGEELAAAYLCRQGYRILARNFRWRGGELDIIARDRREVVFVEVKTRRTSACGLPQESVTLAKQRQLARAAQVWLAEQRLTDSPARFDVLAIYLPAAGAPQIEHLKNAFDLPA